MVRMFTFFKKFYSLEFWCVQLICLNPAVNPALGFIIFMLGGLAGAVFYLPFKKK
jgi:hypothetical protein